MTDDQLPDNSLPDPQDGKQPSRWQRAVAAVGRVAVAPFNTAGYLYRTGQQNRHFTLPVLNGAFGDQLAERHDRRAIQMSFRRHGADVSVAMLRLEPTAEGRPRKTVVFLHGLMGDEVIWQAGSPEGLRYGPRLQQDTGAHCLYVRYNSGLHISKNGKQLNLLLSELLATFPDAIGDLVLVGHSMGGLVIRSAGYYAALLPHAPKQEVSTTNQAEHSHALHSETSAPLPQPSNWLAHLRDVFLLGVPNDGSFLEQNSHFTSVVLRKINLRPTRFISGLIDKRSNGIKDLRHAILVDEDWQDPHANDLFPPRTLVPPLPGVRYHVLVGSLLKSANSALHDYFGDGLVGAGSALGRVFGDPALPPEQQISTRVFSKLHHGTLLSNQEVYQYLRDRINQTRS
ncbi:alpha/beta hydrolase [Hymenobacter sp. YC55]|uniref:esterase/lipase family protein n=1 Tax=Hymenobacter sp. YC55 TaxID=3034019 RepID=UPI0023FA3884|nr:alpha/beta hydrolase [Hymenobacter sp. YC55]MDF7813695.1 alpha/beta hydrolase [Hymenobacter sp. YC55]